MRSATAGNPAQYLIAQRYLEIARPDGRRRGTRSSSCPTRPRASSPRSAGSASCWPPRPRPPRRPRLRPDRPGPRARAADAAARALARGVDRGERALQLAGVVAGVGREAHGALAGRDEDAALLEGLRPGARVAGGRRGGEDARRKAAWARRSVQPRASSPVRRVSTSPRIRVAHRVATHGVQQVRRPRRAPRCWRSAAFPARSGGRRRTGSRGTRGTRPPSSGSTTPARVPARVRGRSRRRRRPRRPRCRRATCARRRRGRPRSRPRRPWAARRGPGSRPRRRGCRARGRAGRSR